MKRLDFEHSREDDRLNIKRSRPRSAHLKRSRFKSTCKSNRQPSQKKHKA